MVPQPASPPPSDYDERSHLHDEFSQMMVSLQEVAASRGECFMDYVKA